MPWSRPLVEVGPHAERARGHAAPAQVVGEPGEFVVVGDADVGEAVGEQQDAVHALGREAGGDLLAARQPAAVEVGRAAGVDGLEPLGGERAALGSGDDAVDHDLDLVVVDHRREAVGRLQPVDGLEDRLAGEADLVLAAHRPGRSRTKPRLTGGRRRRRIRGDRGRSQGSTSRKRSLRPLARMSCRSGRTASRGSRSRAGVEWSGLAVMACLSGFRARRRTGPGRSGPAARRACWSAGPAAGARGSRCRR